MHGAASRLISGVVGALAALSLSPHASGQVVNESAKLLASDGAAGDLFGLSVALSGDVVVVGAREDDDNGADSGSAYVFRWNGSSWVQEQKLLASDGEAGDWFGGADDSVCVFGDVIVVGAYQDDDNGTDSGSVYVFRWNGSSWVQEQKLLPSDGEAGDTFGRSVSGSGDVLAVSASLDDENGQNRGSVYMFRWNGTTWVQEQKLLASDGGPHQWFGTSISLSGDVVVMGSPKHTHGAGPETGAAYVFRWNGLSWVEEQELLAPDGAEQDFFGYSVSVSGNVVIVGAHQDDDNGTDSGSAYVFRWNGSSWVQEQKLLASDGTTGDFFGGSAVSVSGDVIVVGALHDDDNGTDSGSAYVFRWNGSSWMEEEKLLASDGVALDQFGFSAFVSGGVAVVGAPGNDEPEGGPYSGSAYVFELAGCDGGDGVNQKWDLATDWSYTSNPNGVWTLYEGQDVLMTTVIPDWWSTCPGGSCFAQAQPAWARDTCNTFGDVPTWMKALSPPCATFDLPEGKVGVHGSKNKFGVLGSTGVTWTSPVNGVIEITGGVWLADDISGRPMDWALYHNSQRLTGGHLFQGDPYSSQNPFDFGNGDGGPSVVMQGIVLGDTIGLEVSIVPGFAATWVGIDLSMEELPDCNSNGIFDSCDVDCGPAGVSCDVLTCGGSADCNANCVPDECEQVCVCGNGVVEEGEECDGGNTQSGDCCSAACEIEPAGTQCDDGNACTIGDTCSAGACVGGPPPDCDDDNVCTDDSCDPATGCMHVDHAAPSAGRVSWWPFDDDVTGLVAADIVDGNDGTLTCFAPCVGNPVFTSDAIVGNALSFDGVDDYVEVPDNVNLRITDTVSIDFWARRQRLPDACKSDFVLEKGGDWTGGETNYGVGLHCDVDPAPLPYSVNFLFAGGYRTTAGKADLEWHHYAVVATNGDANPRFYIDGIESNVNGGGGAATINLFPSSRPLHIGAQVDPMTLSYFGANIIDELQIYNGALSQEDIQAIFSAGSSGKCRPPGACPCDDGNACTTDDTCSAGACVGGPPLDCNDDNICTDDSCDPATGCGHVDNTAPCDDGNACTAGDTCSAGACVAGPALDCNDDNVCTDDSCDPGTGCVHAGITACISGDGCCPEGCADDSDCVPGAIPTVSEWGLVVLTFLLLTGIKIKFGGRQAGRVAA